MDLKKTLSKETQENLIKEQSFGFTSSHYLIGTHQKFGKDYQIQILVTRDDSEFLDEE